MVARPSSLVHLETDSSYLPEVYMWFAVSVVVLFLRWAVRIRTVGIKGFEGDDFISILFLGFVSLNVAIVHITYYTGGNIDVTAEQVKTLPERDIAILTYGSVMEFVSWYSYPALIWCLKFKVLFFYRRLKSTLWWNNKILNCVFWVTGISFVALATSVSLTCKPYSANWQISPLPGPECTFRPQNFWILVVLNVATDAVIMIIPIPIVWHLRASRLRKFGVSLLLLSGLFMIATAVIRAARTIYGTPSVININRWGFRETTVGVIAANAPILVPLFTRAFWIKGTYNPQPRLRPDRNLYVALPSRHCNIEDEVVATLRPGSTAKNHGLDNDLSRPSKTKVETIEMNYIHGPDVEAQTTGTENLK